MNGRLSPVSARFVGCRSLGVRPLPSSHPTRLSSRRSLTRYGRSFPPFLSRVDMRRVRKGKSDMWVTDKMTKDGGDGWTETRPWGGRITWGNRTVRSLGSPFVSSHSLPSPSLGPYVPSAEPVTSGVSEETNERREWPVNDEDERLDQDMRKDDEEPRAAREWGSRSISPVNRSSPALFGSSHTRLLSLASCAPLRPSRMSVAKEVRRRGHRKEEKGKEWRAGWQGC